MADPYRTRAEPDRPPMERQKARELVLPVLCAGLLIALVHVAMQGGGDPRYPVSGERSSGSCGRVSSPQSAPAWQQHGPGYATSILHASPSPHMAISGRSGGRGGGGRR